MRASRKTELQRKFSNRVIPTETNGSDPSEQKGLAIGSSILELPIPQLHWEYPHTRRSTEGPRVQYRSAAGGVLDRIHGAKVQSTIYRSCFYRDGRYAETCDWLVADLRKNVEDQFFNFNVHSPQYGSADEDKDVFYAQLALEYDRFSSYDTKIVIRKI